MRDVLATWTSVGCVVACLALAPASAARAATLGFTGTLRILIANLRDIGGAPAYLSVAGGGSALINASGGGTHLSSLALAGASFGPATAVFPGSALTGTRISSLRLTLAQNLTGSFSGISGGPPGAGSMGLSGIAKICLSFGAPGCINSIAFPLTPSAGGAGLGIGGTRTAIGGVNLTLQHAPWTVGQPVMTIHAPNSTVTAPLLPGGFAHGPASLTSSTARPSGVLQLVTASKVFTDLSGAFPELPLTGILALHFAPEPGTLMLLGSGAGLLAVLGRRRGRR